MNRKIKNGIIYIDDKPTIGIGTTYYGSFHHSKWPVPPEGDRIGIMKSDICEMKEYGYNILRMAAIDFIPKDSELSIIDESLKEAEKAGLAVMLRLHGYTMNLSGYDDYFMIDSKGNKMNTEHFANFIQNSLHHKGIIKDNETGTKMLADYFKKFENIVGYVIYNEPHYPGGGLFDYSTHTIEAYRKKLIDSGRLSEKQAKEYEPPRKRPENEEQIGEWIEWRKFAIDSMTDFLNASAKFAKETAPDIETLTCLTPSYISNGNVLGGLNNFKIAEGMDIFGITHYVSPIGSSFYYASMILENAECAARIYDKHYWVLEADSRCDVEERKFNAMTYQIMGSGAKGLLYYQWRGDYPCEKSPEPDMFGVIHSDGRKSGNYDNGKRMTKLINTLSDKLVRSERIHDKTAIIYSMNAYIYCDGTENKETIHSNSFFEGITKLHMCLKDYDITPDIITVEHLNILKPEIVICIGFDNYTEEEKKIIRNYESTGNSVYIEDHNFINNNYGFKRMSAPERAWWGGETLSVRDILDENKAVPVISFDSCYIKGYILENDDSYIVSIINRSSVHDTINDVLMKTGKDISFTEAVMYTADDVNNLEVKDSTVKIPTIRDGAFILLKK